MYLIYAYIIYNIKYKSKYLKYAKKYITYKKRNPVLRLYLTPSPKPGIHEEKGERGERVTMNFQGLLLDLHFWSRSWDKLQHSVIYYLQRTHSSWQSSPIFAFWAGAALIIYVFLLSEIPTWGKWFLRILNFEKLPTTITFACNLLWWTGGEWGMVDGRVEGMGKINREKYKVFKID